MNVEQCFQRMYFKSKTAPSNFTDTKIVEHFIAGGSSTALSVDFIASFDKAKLLALSSN